MVSEAAREQAEKNCSEKQRQQRRSCRFGYFHSFRHRFGVSDGKIVPVREKRKGGRTRLASTNVGSTLLATCPSVAHASYTGGSADADAAEAKDASAKATPASLGMAVFRFAGRDEAKEGYSRVARSVRRRRWWCAEARVGAGSTETWGGGSRKCVADGFAGLREGKCGNQETHPLFTTSKIISPKS